MFFVRCVQFPYFLTYFTSRHGKEGKGKVREGMWEKQRLNDVSVDSLGLTVRCCDDVGAAETAARRGQRETSKKTSGDIATSLTEEYC